MFVYTCMYVCACVGPYDNNVVRRYSPWDCGTFEGHVQVVDAFTMRWKKLPSSERVSESSVLFFFFFLYFKKKKSKNIFPCQFLMSVCPIDAWGASDASLRSKVNWRKLNRVAVVLQLQGGRWSASEAFSLVLLRIRSSNFQGVWKLLLCFLLEQQAGFCAVIIDRLGSKIVEFWYVNLWFVGELDVRR